MFLQLSRHGATWKLPYLTRTFTKKKLPVLALYTADVFPLKAAGSLPRPVRIDAGASFRKIWVGLTPAEPQECLLQICSNTGGCSIY